LFAIGVLCVITAGRSQLVAQDAGKGATDDESACRVLADFPALNVTLAEVRQAGNEQQRYCHVRGLIAPGTRYHVQLPLPSRWNGRLLAMGDGGKDGVVALVTNPFVVQKLLGGYVVVNSNSGHDAAVEPNGSFAFNNRQAEIDYGHRAVHLSTIAAKFIAQAYYKRAPSKSYFDGCSAGGRQGLMQAQRYPNDFDGIIAGAPANYFQAQHVARIAVLQRLFADSFRDNLAFDTDKNGVAEDTSKLALLTQQVLTKCDALDGITDGVLDHPPSCAFRPEADLSHHACAGDVNGPACFTKAQIRLIAEIYRGPHDSRGRRIIKGLALGSEAAWGSAVIPHAGNKLRPGFLGNAGDFPNYLFFEHDPGVAPADLADVKRPLQPHEYGWWQFNIDDVTAGKGRLMSQIIDASDTDLTTFVGNSSRKLILYHGWSDPMIPAEPTLDYYREMVQRTFKGNVSKARSDVRLFMFPGMDHCGGGAGPNQWGDTLAALVEWVEKGSAPDFLVAEHRTKSVVDNQRKVCAYPQRAVYVGPAGQQNDSKNWIAENFQCR
jgi:feruloyl esterase